MQDKGSDGLDILSIFFSDPEHGWVLTSAQLLETHDGGALWTAQLEQDGLEKIFDSPVFADSDTAFIVGKQRKNGHYDPMILRTGDRGGSWQEVLINTSPLPSTQEGTSVQSSMN